MIAPDATLREVAFAVGTALERDGIQAVLCGGSAATFYAPDVYQSEDLDFVLTFDTDGALVKSALSALGYAFENQMFIHPDSHFTVEFPKGPLAIGAEVVSTFDTVRESDQTLHIVSPTDVVRDRLNKYAAWDDFSALRAASASRSSRRSTSRRFAHSCIVRDKASFANGSTSRSGRSSVESESAGCSYFGCCRAASRAPSRAALRMRK